MNITPAKLYLYLVRRLHFLVLLSTMVPCICLSVTFGMNAQETASADSLLLPLYLITLSLAIPAAYLYLMQEKVKGFFRYLFCTVPVTALYLYALFSLEEYLILSVRGAEKIVQALILLLYLLDAIHLRLNENSRKRAKKEADLSWTGDLYFLPPPALPILVPFALIYIGALFLHSDGLAQSALIGAIFYFFLVLPWHVLERKEDFLDQRHRISRIPRGRISRLLASSLARVLIPCALLAAASFLTSGGRHFLTLPALHPNLPPDFNRPWGYEENGLYRELMELSLLEHSKPVPLWLTRLIDFTENALTLFLTALIAYWLRLAVRSVRARFLKVAEDEDPAAAFGLERDEHISLKGKTSRKAENGSTNRKSRSIRRRYRKTILSFRGSPPDPWETPEVMERLADLPDTPAMHALHEDYEKARYGARYDSAAKDDRSGVLHYTQI